MLPFNLVILGSQGSGKGTQARLLSEKFQMPYLSAGELIRKKAEEDSPEGRGIKKIHDSGRLIPLALTRKLFEQALKKIPQSQTVIFEGYPRTGRQVDDFEKIAAGRKIKEKKIIILQVSEKTVYQRLSGRRLCSLCEKNYYPPASLELKNCSECGGELVRRRDDTKEAIKKRLNVYKTETKKVLNYYQTNKEALLIDGESSIQQVNEEILKNLGSLS